MKEFLTEFADLLQKHKVTIDAEVWGDGSSFAGFEVTEYLDNCRPFTISLDCATIEYSRVKKRAEEI